MSKIMMRLWTKNRYSLMDFQGQQIKSYEIAKIYQNISLLLDQAQEHEIRFLLIIFIDKTTLRKQNVRQRNFQKHFKFHKFSEIFYCSMTRLRNTRFSIFMQFQYTRTILRKKSMGQSQLKKHSKFQIVDAVFYCGITRLKDTNFDFFI